MIGLLLVLTLALPAVQAVPLQPAPERLNGVWDLNRDLSTKPAAPPGERGGDGGRGGGRPGGGGGMPPGGGMPGGMGGGRGGMRGGGPEGSGASGGDMQKVRAVMQELGQSPARLMIVSRDGAVSITDPEGVNRRFVANGKAEKIAINGSTVEVKSSWDGEPLTQEFKAGSVKMVRIFETTTDGRQLVVTVTPKGESGAASGPGFQRFVYTRADTR